MPSTGGTRGLAVAILLALAAPACGDDGSTEPAQEVSADTTSDPSDDRTYANGAPFTVETFSETFVDDSRPTDDPEGERTAPTRTLETDVYVPDGDGPFPLVVHAHGFDGNAGKYSRLLTSWAEAGYVVAAPTFPLTNDLDDTPGVLADYENQPGDLSFVIDELLALASGAHPTLAGAVDEERIGVSGHSLGGITGYGLVFNSCCRDDRIDALLVLNSRPLDFEDGSFAFEATPLMLTLSSDDPIIAYDEALAPYNETAGPKLLMTLESHGHFEPYEDVESPHDDVVSETTTAFWDAHLRDDPDAADRLVAAVEAHDLTELTTE